MRRSVISNGVVRLVGCWLAGMAVVLTGLAQDRAGPRNASNEVRVVYLSSPEQVEVMRSRAGIWDRAYPDQPLSPGDRIRTKQHGRALLQLSDQSYFRLNPLTELIIQPPEPRRRSVFRLLLGRLYFFHRDTPSDLRIDTPSAAGAVRGTEFVIEVDENRRTTLTLLDGEVELSNDQDSVVLRSGERGVADPGARPTRTALLQAEADRAIQWCLYYPGVLDPAELDLTTAEQQTLAESLSAYRNGDLLQALAKYPAGRQPGSASEALYLSALWLAVGQVDQTERLLAGLATAAATNDRVARLGRALHTVIDATRFQTVRGPAEPESLGQLATEWLAASYAFQAERRLEEALSATTRAAERSPQFGFAWARAAELEFGFGRIRRASDHLKRSLELSPQNAQALALQGFLLSAENKIGEAITWFDRAMAVDGALGNAWLGRGLCRIRKNQSRAGREDLAVAAALEPQRAVLRSYLGKAYSDAGDDARARHELGLARKLDANDPTSWLYSALNNQRRNRINEAIRDLEKSQELNENRSVYRSRLLLDQDRAVRSANLALAYQDAGMGDVAVREAGRGVGADYADYSAHAFLASSYEVERRANLSNLRFEAASFNEYLLANLLGPANGRLLAQPITQLEYSQLFERNRFGLIANTEYFSRGAWRNSSAQYGTRNGSSYSLEDEYWWDPGERANQDLEILQLEAKFKHDFTPDDSAYFHVIGYQASGGDVAQHFDESEVSRTLRFEEEQVPTILAGYHHQWSPQHHTLFLAGYFNDTLDTADPASTVLAADRTTGQVIGFAPVDAGHTYRSRVELCSAEAQHIAAAGRHSLILGARGQWSNQRVADSVADPAGMYYFLLGVENPVTVQNVEVTSSCVAIYAYDHLRLADTLEVVGGLNFTYQSIPVNTMTAPVTSETEQQEKLCPKAGFIWSPSSSSSVSAHYTKSLTGSGLGQSVRLEPTQVAGLLQTFRAPVPPSLVGPLDGADLQTAALLWEGRFRDTYLSLGGQWLTAERTRQLGLFLADDPDYLARPSLGLIEEDVRFREYAFDASAHQLVGKEWSFGVRYRLAYAQLERSFPEYPGLATGGLDDNSDWRGWLHTLNLTGLYRHRSGVFVRADGVLFAQDREREGASLPGDTFWQVNAIVGYRFPRQKAEVAVGLLNALDTDYRLDPVNQYADQPRSRTFYARLLLNF